MVKKEGLSVCIITKNEEKHISHCLQNIQEIADEILIIDLGSRDLTIDIARKAGVKVYEMKWNNDFSEAKNLCLNHAKGRWILFLKPNEWIPKEEAERLPSLLANPNVEGYLLSINYSLQNYKISSPIETLRLIRNRKEYRYQYRIFERIPDNLLSNIKDADIRIMKKGELPLLKEVNIEKLLLEDLKNTPEDSYLQYIYGIELLNQQRYEESIIYFQKACKNVNFDYLFAPHLYKSLSWALISLKKNKEALDILEEGIKFFPLYTDLLVLRGKLQRDFHQYHKGIQDLEKCLKIRKQSGTRVSKPEINTATILEMLGEIHEEVFNYQLATSCYYQAYHLKKSNQYLLNKIGNLVKKICSTEMLDHLLQEAVKENNAQQLITLMDILTMQREYSRVLSYVEDLESLIGKGEETESIKFLCYLMMGEVEKSTLHFSSISKRSPLYTHILLQRIENYWGNNQWQEAEELLKEIQDSENIIKPLYHLIHRLLTKKELTSRSLGKEATKIIHTLMEDFLWLEQVEKARLLLHQLLQEGEENHYIKLTEPWAERNDYTAIEKIFICIEDKKMQHRFKEKVMEQLLRADFIDSAEKLKRLGDTQSLGVLEYVLWSKSFMNKLEGWIEKAYENSTTSIVTEVFISQMKTKPSKALLAFYYNLSLGKNDRNIKTFEPNTEEMTCADIHREIGNLYIKTTKKQEALTAYLRALQWHPLDDRVQEKIRDLYDEGDKQLSYFLEKGDWALEGSWFHDKEEFIDYVLGLIHFQGQQYEKALEFFSKTAKQKTSNPVILAYMFSSLWLDGKEEEAEKFLSEEGKKVGVLSQITSICNGYALKKLEKGCQQYPYSELIKREKDKILNSSC